MKTVSPTEVGNAQILIMVPKRHELRACSVVFDLDYDRPDLHITGKYEAWQTDVAGLLILFVLVDEQSNASMALATNTAIQACDPSLSICLGTAAGREKKTRQLDVMLPTAIMDASENRKPPGSWESQWKPPQPLLQDVRHDIESFVFDVSKNDELREECSSLTQKALDELRISPALLDVGFPRVIDGWAASTSTMQLDPEFLGRLWQLHSRLKTVDMETAGFAEACTNDPRQRLWCVVRGVSDYGSEQSRSDDYTLAASSAAAAVCRVLIEHGLRRSHPLNVNPKATGESKLSEGNMFVRRSMREFMRERLQDELSISFDTNTLTPDLGISDLEIICKRLIMEQSDVSISQDIDLAVVLDHIRAEYFTQKYQDYDDSHDVRGYVGPSWADEVDEVFRFLDADRILADILYVGVSTGRDLATVCPEFKSLRGIDLSRDMLERASEREPRMLVFPDRAEALSSIGDASVDIYISLRTYQSALFDMAAALRQAYRVLRPGGAIVISIPGGFVEKDAEGELTYIPGLLMPGSRVVDPVRPRTIANRILHHLEQLMFEKIGFHQRETDLYLYGRMRGA